MQTWPLSSTHAAAVLEHSTSNGTYANAEWSLLSSEPSDTESDMSANAKRRAHAKKRKWKKKMFKLRLELSNATPDPPFVYSGEPDFTLYQKWVLEAKDWLKYSFVQRKHRVPRLKKYLAGRAFLFYMRDVARTPERWTLAHFLKELFDYCFPTNFRTIQREKFLEFSQRGSAVRDYRRALEELARSVGNISSRDIAIRFWQGTDRYLRVKWAENGFDPEISTIEELEEAAECYKRALMLQHAEARDFQVDSQQHDRPHDQFTDSNHYIADASADDTPPSKTIVSEDNNTSPEPSEFAYEAHDRASGHPIDNPHGHRQ